MVDAPQQPAVQRFRFVSWTYIAVALLVPIPLVLFGVIAFTEMPWVSVLAIGVPAAIAFAMLRRGMVSVALEGDRLVVRRGLWLSASIPLPSASEDAAEDPYREDGDDARAPVVRLEEGDHADFELRNPMSRYLFTFTKVARVLFRVMSTSYSSRSLGEAVEVDVAMTELSLRDADGQMHRFVVPTQGKRNAAKLKALAAALEDAGHPPIGQPTG